MVPLAWLIAVAGVRRLGPDPAEAFELSTGEWSARALVLTLLALPAQVDGVVDAHEGAPRVGVFRIFLRQRALCFFPAVLSQLGHCRFVGGTWGVAIRHPWVCHLAVDTTACDHVHSLHAARQGAAFTSIGLSCCRAGMPSLVVARLFRCRRHSTVSRFSQHCSRGACGVLSKSSEALCLPGP